MEVDENVHDGQTVLARLKSEEGVPLPGGLLDLPINVTVEQLQLICNALLKEEDPIPLAFYVNNVEVEKCLKPYLSLDKNFSVSENVVDIIYQPQAIFKVRSVTRCTGELEGHTEAVLAVQFSPNGQLLASGSGDKTLRLWDIHTQTPYRTCIGHASNVLCVSWSPCGKKVASASENGKILVWNAEDGAQIGKPMTAHKKWITCLSWEPFHSNETCRFLVSSSKDSTLRIWDTVLSQTVRELNGHSMSVTCVKWGGRGLIYSSSQDRTIKVWKADDGKLCRVLEGHGHWVNTLALNADYALRTGAFEITNKKNDLETPKERAKRRYEAVGEEMLVSGSDDFTLILWKPETSKKPFERMTGHQQLINDVKFSPDGRLIASASFDKSIKLWNGITGKFVAVLRGHVQRVHSIAWSADSRLIVSGSADSTLKAWNIKAGKDKNLLHDLPGHGDEVYAVDWAPSGDRVASGGKDKALRLWQN